MRSTPVATAALLALGLVARRVDAAAPAIAAHAYVADGPGIDAAAVRPRGGAWRSVGWDALASTPLEPGAYEVRVEVTADADAAGAAVEIPPCAGRRAVTVDGAAVAPNPAAPDGPMVAPIARGTHEVILRLDVSRYERRIACGERVRGGAAATSTDGFGVLAFDSPHRGGGRAVVYVPPGHDRAVPGALLVGAHPWNGGVWTYAAYEELVREARARDVVLLMPSGLGNSLYTADAEDEVLRAIDAATSAIAVDPRRVSIWGASMGGAGATTIGFHHPDRFASVTSFFGDSKYDLATYVRALLPDAAAAHRVNAVDVVENARHVPTWLIHGEDDATSPVAQSSVLADALHERGFAVRFDRVPGIGHAGALVARFAAQVVDTAADARAEDRPARVTYRSVRATDDGAYGVRIARASARGDAFVDVERRDDGVHVLRAEGVRAVVFVRGALGTRADAPPRIVVDAPGASGVRVGWEDAP